ncbi:duplicated orphan permease [Filimonas lacunae]|uniref:Duplicated orphan permease n=1 Tax=Filimonas lacunae TaxID=477680 RepID=A0A173MFH9_9BACT|nr:ABC transporter permease [Filimonas lacunae]BAV06237.1 ABC transporter, permease protein [Filimonas lacunae]SIT25401.1 duplicated orphan permease [Filimonas lacunae]
MLATYWKNGFRSIRQNKTYSFLNIFGLAIGIACAGFIFLWVESELNYNKHNANYNHLYVVKTNSKVDAGIFTHTSTPGLLGPSLKAEVPGIANTCRTTEDNTSLLFATGNQHLYVSGRYADSSVFSMFTLPFVQGNVKNAFTQLYSVVITESAARKIFGNAGEVVGKTVRIDNKDNFTVTGVVKDPPENSSFKFEWLMPFPLYAQSNPYIQNWGDFGTRTYVQLAEKANVGAVNKQLLTYLQTKGDNSGIHFFLFAMKQWRLYSSFANGKPSGGGRIEFVRLFTVIAWIILLIACINFMNLATARSEKRAREVGVRKVLGAARGSLILQFTSEAVFMAMVAALLAIGVMVMLLPAFNMLVEKHLSLGLNQPQHIWVLLGLTLICGVFAGSYPSFYLSSFNPVFILKGMKAKAGSAAFLRKSLVVVQFSVSIILIIATVIIYRQIQHVKNRNLGFNKNNLVCVPIQGNMERSFPVIKQELLNTGMIENAALLNHYILADGNNTTSIGWPGKKPDTRVVISQRMITPEYFATVGIELSSGRGINEGDMANLADVEKKADSTSMLNVVITQSMEKLMETRDAIGSLLTLPVDEAGHIMQMRVVGVVKDYVYGDMYKSSAPVVFYGLRGDARALYVRTKATAPVEKSLAAIEGVMKRNNPDYPFDYTFVDDSFNSYFDGEMLVSKLSRVFASLAILISCLGLFGLASYTAERRTREIGIRKVLGATNAGIAVLLWGEFIKLVMVSCLIAFPLAAWTMHQWLSAYAYRISLSGWVFVAAGAASVAIALGTISIQAIKAAVANPVKNLKRE